MRRTLFRLLASAVAVVTAVTAGTPIAAAQAATRLIQSPGSTSGGPIHERLVTVGPPKVYDDLYLRGLLSNLQNQLANTRGIDQATLLSHIGVAQGADLKQSSIAFSANGPSTPQTSTFALPPGVPAFSYPPGYTGSPASGSSPTYPSGVATAQTPGTTTTINSMTPTAPAPTAPTLALPGLSSLGQSSLDTYNESLQLSSEITNTALLLQPSMSDSFTSDGSPKTTITIGFPITFEAPSKGDKELAGAVAEVHVAICSPDYVKRGEFYVPVVTDGQSNIPDASYAPSIVTLLPRERTYNVASLVDKNLSASASAVLGGLVNIGGAFAWSHKTYYLVQQQETVALVTDGQGSSGCPVRLVGVTGLGDPKFLQERPTAVRPVTFIWQIHPVLGKEFIRPGNSVNFVQFSVPSPAPGVTEPVAKACVSVVWRKQARKKNSDYLEDAAGAIRSDEQCYEIDYYRSLGRPQKDKWFTVTDIGQGLITVTVNGGTFVPGTTIRLGNISLPPDSITATHDEFKFTVPASAIVAAGKVFFVGRDGREEEALDEYKEPGGPLKITDLTVQPYSDAQSLLKIAFTAPSEKVAGDLSTGYENPNLDPWVVVIGGKVFGLSDAPFFSRTEKEIRLVVPTALIQAAPRIEMRRLLRSDAYYRDSKPILPETFAKGLPTVGGASILSSQGGLILGLTGTNLDHLKIIFPIVDNNNCKGCVVAAEAEGSTFMRVTLKPAPDEKKKGAAKTGKDAPDPTDGLKQLAFCRIPNSSSCKGDGDAVCKDECDPNFPTVVVDVPKQEEASSKPSLDKHDPIPAKTREITVTGTALDQVVLVEYNKRPLPFRVVAGKKASLILNVGEIPADPGSYSLLVTFADKTTAGYLVTREKPGA